MKTRLLQVLLLALLPGIFWLRSRDVALPSTEVAMAPAATRSATTEVAMAPAATRSATTEVAVTPPVVRSAPTASVRADPAGKAPSERRLRTVIDDPIMRDSLYRVPSRMIGTVAPNGAVDLNARWEEGSSPVWYIELQRYGADLIQAGVVLHDDTLIDQGVQILRWGFDRQDASGGFSGTSDAFHSTSMFVEAVARSALLLEDYGSIAYQPILTDFRPRLRAAGEWLINPAREARAQKDNHPYTHRRFLLAAALGQVGAFTGSASMLAAAERYALDGLSLQQADGVLPEKDGPDVNYQALSLLYAARYVLVCRSSSLASRLLTMIRQALAWEVQHVDEQGQVALDGNTRTGVERARDGAIKNVEYRLLIQAICVAAEVIDEPQHREVARRLAQGRKWLGPPDD